MKFEIRDISTEFGTDIDRRERARLLHEAGEALVRKMISAECSIPPEDIVIKKEALGKPYAESLPIHFNISHSGTFAVCVTHSSPIGVDIQSVGKVRPLALRRTFSTEEQEYVLASRAAGSKGSWIIRKHLLPNSISVVIISTALQIPNAIFTESFLSFLGLGVNAPMPSLGSLASDALNGLSSYPYRMIIPAVVISLIVLSLNLFGDGLRDAFDPKLRN